jgi:hypothetical protein
MLTASAHRAKLCAARLTRRRGGANANTHCHGPSPRRRAARLNKAVLSKRQDSAVDASDRLTTLKDILK